MFLSVYRYWTELSRQRYVIHVMCERILSKLCAVISRAPEVFQYEEDSVRLINSSVLCTESPISRALGEGV